MKVQHKLTLTAEAASQRYQLVVEAWRGTFERTVNDPSFGAPATTDTSLLEAATVANLFLAREADEIERVMHEIAREARRATLRDYASIDTIELTNEALELVSETGSYLLNELKRQIKRDIDTLAQALRRVSLEVGRNARARGISRRAAQMEYRIANRSGVNFAFQDRAARRWQSDRFVRTIWRHSLLSIYNEVVLSTIADHGETSAIIDHAAGASNFHGLSISLLSSSELPAYSEVREEIFHPNSDHVLRARAA